MRAGVAALAMLSMTESTFAGESCIRHEEMAALRAAAVQQQLMVAALSCRASSLYNRFVLSYRRELQASDDALKVFFQRRTGSEAEYNAFKTRLANASSLHSIGNSRSYCDEAYAAFDAALSYGRPSLDGFISREPVSLDLGYAECGEGSRLFAREERRLNRLQHGSMRIERPSSVPAETDDGGPVVPRDHELAPDSPAY